MNKDVKYLYRYGKLCSVYEIEPGIYVQTNHIIKPKRKVHSTTAEAEYEYYKEMWLKKKRIDEYYCASKEIINRFKKEYPEYCI